VRVGSSTVYGRSIDSELGRRNSTAPLDLVPVDVDPAPERSEWLLERSAEFGELIRGSGLDALGIEVAASQPVSLGASQRVGEDLIRDTLLRVVNVLVATHHVEDDGRI
jgi:hypothetical protein